MSDQTEQTRTGLTVEAVQAIAANLLDTDIELRDLDVPGGVYVGDLMVDLLAFAGVSVRTDTGFWERRE